MLHMMPRDHIIEIVETDLGDLVKVGEYEKKVVTRQNNTLFLKARDIMTDGENMGLGHIGFKGISAFIDWLENNYKMEKIDG